MLKRLSWKDGGVISLQLRDGLFALAQMRVSPYMQFYAVSSSDGSWAGVDLGAVPSLFCVAVSGKRLMPLMVEMVDQASVTADRRDMPRKMIDAKPNFEGGYAFKGGDLILLDERGETVGAPVLQADLEVGKDDEVIRNHELTNMWVVPEKLRDRLIGFFETGVNWDEHKERVFPGILPPKPLRSA